MAVSLLHHLSATLLVVGIKTRVPALTFQWLVVDGLVFTFVLLLYLTRLINEMHGPGGAFPLFARLMVALGVPAIATWIYLWLTVRAEHKSIRNNNQMALVSPEKMTET